MGHKSPTDKIMLQQKPRKKSLSLQFPLNTPKYTSQTYHLNSLKQRSRDINYCDDSISTSYLTGSHYKLVPVGGMF